MAKKAEHSLFDDVYRFTPDVHGDIRGFFKEVYRKDNFLKQGIDFQIIQINQSHSVKNVIRGLHFQWDKPLSKLIRVTRGVTFMAVVDIRKKSDTLGTWTGFEVSEHNHAQIFVPFGFAAGFCVLSDFADVEYYYDAFYNPKSESNIAWNDPDIGIDWHIKDPILSDRDKNAQSLQQWLKKEDSNRVV